MIDVARDDMVLMLEAGYIYLAMYRFKEARAVFTGVSALAPKHDVPLVALANVSFAQGKYPDSIKNLKAAIKLNPNSAFAYAHLGESQLFLGKYDDGKASLKKAIELDPKGKSAEFSRSLLGLMDKGYDPVKYKLDQKKAKAK